jgi:hypothetical protein
MPSLGDASIESARKAYGGQITPLPQTKTRWYIDDVEAAKHAADGGNLARAAQLMAAARRDGILNGVMSTRTSGLVQLPKRFRGRSDMVDALQAGGTVAVSVFDQMFPPMEVAAVVRDGIEIGVGVAEMLPVEGRDFPVMVRRSPEFLVYRWNENRWYFRSIIGLIPITPGDGRWILHVPGARDAPWQSGLWECLGKAWVRKENASLDRDSWESKLAHPARVAVAPTAATEVQRINWFRKVAGWGRNTVFATPAGYDVKIVESNGRGYESFKDTIAEQNTEMTIAIAGQTVTTDGGAGFSNADIHKAIRADLIQSDGLGIAHTINTQGLPAWVIANFGEDALNERATVEWDTTPPKDRASEAQALVTIASAITTLSEALKLQGRELDVDALVVRFGVPVKAIEKTAAANDAKPKLSLVKEAA